MVLLALSSMFAGTVYAKPPTAIAGSADFPSAPILRIEAGMHTESIMSTSVDSAGRFLVTGSLDKTVRIWSLTRGTLLRTIRPPIAEGREGGIAAVALSPDGKTIACGGVTDFTKDRTLSIYLFDRATGTLLRRITGLPDTISALSFSRDGFFLAAGCAVGGIRIFATADYKLISETNTVAKKNKQENQDDRFYGGACQSMDWGTNDRLVTSCADGYVRLYEISPQFKQTAAVKAPGDAYPHTVCFSPDSDRIAVAFNKSNSISVVSSRNLQPLFSPDTSNMRLEGYLCWSGNGTQLFASGNYYNIADNTITYFIRCWSEGGLQTGKDIPMKSGEVTGMSTLPAGSAFDDAFVYTGGPSWIITKSDGSRVAGKKSPAIDFMNNYLSLLANRYGDKIVLSDRLAQKSDDFNIFDRSLTHLEGSSENVDGLLKTNTGSPPSTEPGEESLCSAITPDQQTLLVATYFGLRCYDAIGKEEWRVIDPGYALKMNVVPGGEGGAVGIVAFADGTIRWYRMRDGKEVLDYFPDADGQRWVLWTPEGYYDCSPGGEDLIGWHINRGENQAADFYPASRFRDTYYQPDMIRVLLKTLDVQKAFLIASSTPGYKHVADGKNAEAIATPSLIETRLPPVIRILSPADYSTASAGTVTVGFTVRAPDDAPVLRVRALVDGRSPEGSRGFDFGALATSSVTAATVDGSSARQIVVPLPGHDCVITLIAENKNGASEESSVRVKSSALASAVLPVLKPKLYVLAVGVAKYIVPGNNLEFPSKDAGDFIAAVKAQSGGLYREVEVRSLVDTQATKANVLNGLEWIERQATSRDVAMVFISGHGDMDPDGDYYFLTHDFDGVQWKSTAVSWRDIQETLRNIKGKAVFFVDTCHAGGVDGASGTHRKGMTPDINGLINDLTSAENGVVVFAASTGRQSALENNAWGNGAFSLALIEAITGKNRGTVPPNKDALAAMTFIRQTGKTTIDSLDAYLAERVKQLTDGKQTPTTTKPQTVPDFPIAAVH